MNEGLEPRSIQPDSFDAGAEPTAAPMQPATSAPRVAAEARRASSPDARWDRATKRTVILVMLAGALVVLWLSLDLLPVLIVAGIVAYILSPVVDLFERVRVPRAVTTIGLYVALLVILILTPVLLAPVLVNQLTSLSFDVPSTALRLFGWIGTSLNNLPDTVEFMGREIPISGLTAQVESSLHEFTFIPTLSEVLAYIQQGISTATNVVSSTASISITLVGGIVQAVVTFLLIFFLSLYLTKDAPSIRDYIEGLFPESYQSEWIDLFRRMGNIWQAFFRGQLILMFSIFLATWAALSALGMPGALLLAILAGMLEIVPSLGPTLAMVPAVLVALIQGSDTLAVYGINNVSFALITIATYFLIQQMENNILVPRIIGGVVNLHPIVIICGVVVGFRTFGILGALFAAPVIASSRVLGAYIHAKLLDYQPFANERPRRRPYVYRRTVTGKELAARPARPRPESADALPVTTAAANPVSAATEPPAPLPSEPAPPRTVSPTQAVG